MTVNQRDEVSVGKIIPIQEQMFLYCVILLR